ncbi:cysteine-rich receptor-like protein kinase 2 isoform X1 [Neltuma alba]|uniref:cysteine-rich receptor-like protein kinase 2 isoform X1 n=1 Tax=Neltuma alba TaxID=207710 RepID=UPI0010A56A02|nr:cysteine-rich receptor-like protein kinase 2 isoform X1 [Prosopis alba]
MLQRPNLLNLFISIFWACWVFYGVVSDPQTNLLMIGCSPPNQFVVSDYTIFNDNLNLTLQEIREQISDPNKHFATAREGNGGNPVSTLLQCRNYLSVADCVRCLDVAAAQIRSCSTGSYGGHVVYDGCFLRYEAGDFYGETKGSLTKVLCGNQNAREVIPFTATAQNLLMNLQTATPKIPGFSAATKIQVPTNGETIYAFAQCVGTVTQSGCLDCLKAAYSNMQICLSNSEGRAFDAGCFIRYSTTSFFADNETIDITPLVKPGSSSNKATIIGGVVGVLALVLVLLALFAWTRRSQSPRRVPRGDKTETSKLEGPITYSYQDLRSATKNFSDENKLGEGGFGIVYKGTLRDGKEVAVKKLTLRNSRKMEEGFESEVMLISDAHHPNLVQLLGWCSSGLIRILVYEYMKNNSLDKFLFGEKKGFLNWKQRCDIILGIASGLTYLHEQFRVRIIHRDIKTNNILLDNDLQPRVADFGLARLLPEDRSHLSTKFAGTLGYTAPEYAIHGQLSEKADIYSYGIVILEIISGQRSKALKDDGDTEDDFLLPKAWKLYEKGMHLELVDNTLDPNEYDADEVKKIIEIGLLCTQAFADLRPTMSEVIGLLQSSDLLENITPSMPLLIVTD